MTLLRIAVLLALVAPGGAHAASNVSAKFDGTYEGAATPAPAISAAGCKPFIVSDIAISAGFLKSPKGSGLTVSGFVTEEGYVSASLARAGRPSYPLDGRLEDGVISAGFIEVDSGCIWIVHLRRRPQGIPPQPASTQTGPVDAGARGAHEPR